MARVRGFSGTGAFAVVVLVASLSAACGGGKGSGPATGDTGGGGGGDGSGSGGSGSGGTSGSGGSGTSPGGAGGSGGASGGGAPAACSGLAATLGDARTVRVEDTPPAPRSATCWRGTTAPSGELALGLLEDGYHSTTAVFSLWTADGATELASLGALTPATRSDVDPWLHATARGWAGIAGGALRFFDASGAAIGSAGPYVRSSAPGPDGGTVALAQTVTTTAANVTYGPPTLEWLDGSGQVLRTVAIDDLPQLLLVSWGSGHVLAVAAWPDSTRRLGPRARWFDADGTPLTPWFGAPGVNPFFASLHLLLDGSVALSDGDAWRAVFRDGVASADPPPDWLAARPATRLATIRGGRGYAVLPFAAGAGASGGDETSFELVTPAGESCGTLRLPEPPGDGVTRTPVSIEVGQDGTVVQTESLGASGRTARCEFRVWPGLLR